MTDQPTPADIDAALALPDAQAAARMEKWAQAGAVEAQLVLGQFLMEGRGVTVSPAQGFGWFLKAARAGHPMAMNMVGRCYENGWGVSEDQALAASWFRSAAQKGLDWGMYNFATALALGRGVDEDRPAALHWLERAVTLGHAKSMTILGGFYEDGWVVKRDVDRAVSLYQQGAAAGDFRGHFNVARWALEAGDLATTRWHLTIAYADGNPAFRSKLVDYLEAHPLQAVRDVAAEITTGDQV
ncbi:tetratricopeptide repeat protein [Brevundimonas nasdae]|uniref:tetratricopeptide repeat protein n=1 Tax=Brevundimonas nasdae TaxID=172043 RepID=UPI003F68D0F2